MKDPTIEIKKMWQIFAVGADSILELRGLQPKGAKRSLSPKVLHFRVENFASVDDCKAAFEESAIGLNEQGYNIYTTLNPIRADFDGQGAARDSDIRYRDLLLIDIDRVGDTSCPANQSEMEAAKSLAGDIRRYLADRGWANPFVTMSGNGFHLYYILDQLQNNENGTMLVRSMLNLLAKKFDNDIVGIDTAVYNAARITKIPGTIMRKGQETSDRPHRRAYVCNE
jgi:hypothetical protein